MLVVDMFKNKINIYLTRAIHLDREADLSISQWLPCHLQLTL